MCTQSTADTKVPDTSKLVENTQENTGVGMPRLCNPFTWGALLWSLDSLLTSDRAKSSLPTTSWASLNSIVHLKFCILLLHVYMYIWTRVFFLYHKTSCVYILSVQLLTLCNRLPAAASEILGCRPLTNTHWTWDFFFYYNRGRVGVAVNVSETSHHELHDVLCALPLRVSFVTKRRTKTSWAVHVQRLETPADVTPALKRHCYQWLCNLNALRLKDLVHESHAAPQKSLVLIISLQRWTAKQKWKWSSVSALHVPHSQANGKKNFHHGNVF